MKSIHKMILSRFMVNTGREAASKFVQKKKGSLIVEIQNDRFHKKIGKIFTPKTRFALYLCCVHAAGSFHGDLGK